MGQGALGMIIERDVEVVMRDGVILRSHIFRPEADGAFPGLLLRTPYGKPKGPYERFVRAGYAVVTQDSRGRYASDGDYVPFTVENTGDAEDGYDAVEWLAAQPYCDGRVGTFGASYNAWMQWQLAKLRPPHLKAMCAYTIPLELTEVDYPGGFRPGRRIKWWMTSMAPDLWRREGAPPPHTPEEAREVWDDVEHGRWLGLMPWMEVVRHLPKRLAHYAEDWLKEPAREPWKFAEVHQEVAVPNLDFSGWYDHCNGTMAHLGLMQKNGRTDLAREQTKLVIGPWNHPGLGKRQMGNIDFGPAAELDLTDMMIRFFDRWVKDIENGVEQEPAVRYFTMGTGKWHAAATWPPEGMEEATYYLHEEGSLELEAPGSEGADRY
ncbi:CocE/NonD family hydrolase, partial [bacterium]|nr:CocE/NonD family hydrolase [bacterium]